VICVAESTDLITTAVNPLVLNDIPCTKVTLAEVNVIIGELLVHVAPDNVPPEIVATATALIALALQVCIPPAAAIAPDCVVCPVPPLAIGSGLGSKYDIAYIIK
jgi:hypothetical protein